MPTDGRAAATPGGAATGARGMLAPLALTQFIASFAGSNMNVAISSISEDLDTTVHGVQTAITLFLLCMAALMIPGSKLTDILGRKRCLIGGLAVYGSGAVIAAVAPGLGVLILGYSGFEGVGSALMIPPIYILATMFYDNLESRAKAFGVISGAGGIGAAAGPLIGGLITTAISWRASFLLQAAVVAVIIVLSRRIVDPVPPDPTRRFDMVGAALSAAGMLFIVLGILQAGSNWLLLVVFEALGAGLGLWFFLHVRSYEREGREPLLSTSLFRNRTSNLAMVTQNIQWLLLMGSTFVVTVFLQVIHGYSAVQTGVIFTAATAGILVSSLAARRLAEKYPQRTLIVAGFVVTAGRDRATPRAVQGRLERLDTGTRSAGARSRGRRHADSVGQRRAIRVPRGETGRDLGALARACPTSAPRSAPRSPARSWSPTRRQETRPT